MNIIPPASLCRVQARRLAGFNGEEARYLHEQVRAYSFVGTDLSVPLMLNLMALTKGGRSKPSPRIRSHAEEAGPQTLAVARRNPPSSPSMVKPFKLKWTSLAVMVTAVPLQFRRSP